jgi:CDP-glucose 4,6-dehydratase
MTSHPALSTASRLDNSFWSGRSVFLTGHTGFKGAWATLLLGHLGARVTGYALPPQSDADLFNVARAAQDLSHVIGDVRDFTSLVDAMKTASPEIVVHMAAQSLVRQSYDEPVETYAINVMGTVHVLEAARQIPSIRAVVVVTSDKCYENREWEWGYREADTLGGYDPYSNSKGCAELVTACYRRSFFSQGAKIATARAGNVIGGGDWSTDRLVPDAMRAFIDRKALRVRNPRSVRPWQFVLEPVTAYLMLAQRLAAAAGDYADAWNFGPGTSSEVSVGEVVESLVKRWGAGASWAADAGHHVHEASYLKLDCSKANSRLGWFPRTGFDDAINMSVDWYKAYHNGTNMREFTLNQIIDFLQK